MAEVAGASQQPQTLPSENDRMKRRFEKAEDKGGEEHHEEEEEEHEEGATATADMTQYESYGPGQASYGYYGMYYGQPMMMKYVLNYHPLGHRGGYERVETKFERFGQSDKEEAAEERHLEHLRHGLKEKSKKKKVNKKEKKKEKKKLEKLRKKEEKAEVKRHQAQEKELQLLERERRKEEQKARFHYAVQQELLRREWERYYKEQERLAERQHKLEEKQRAKEEKKKRNALERDQHDEREHLLQQFNQQNTQMLQAHQTQQLQRLQQAREERETPPQKQEAQGQQYTSEDWKRWQNFYLANHRMRATPTPTQEEGRTTERRKSMATVSEAERALFSKTDLDRRNMKTVKEFMKIAYSFKKAQNRKDSLDRLLAPDAVFYAPATFPEVKTCKDFVEAHIAIMRCLPNLHILSFTFECQENNRVALRYVATGTHLGEPYKPRHDPNAEPIAPTHKSATWSASGLFELEGGKIKSFVKEWSRVAMYTQLGWPLEDCMPPEDIAQRLQEPILSTTGSISASDSGSSTDSSRSSGSSKKGGEATERLPTSGSRGSQIQISQSQSQPQFFQFQKQQQPQYPYEVPMSSHSESKLNRTASPSPPSSESSATTR